MESLLSGSSGRLPNFPGKTIRRIDYSPGHQIQSHSHPGELKTHIEGVLYKCQHCGCGFKTVKSRLKHHLEKCFEHSKSKMNVGTHLPNPYMDHTSIASSSQGPGTLLHCNRRDSLPQYTKSFKSSRDLEAHEIKNIRCDHPSYAKKIASAKALGRHGWKFHAKRGQACANLNCSSHPNTKNTLADHVIIHQGRTKKVWFPMGQVELSDSFGFTCLLSDFIRHSEVAALNNDNSNRPHVALSHKLAEIPIIFLD